MGENSSYGERNVLWVVGYKMRGYYYLITFLDNQKKCIKSKPELLKKLLHIN